MNNMREKKCIFVIVLLLFYILSFGQNKNFTIGFNNNGLTFGNSMNTNGVRINFLDNNVYMVNGINMACISKSRISSGLTLGIISIENSICNGIVVNGLVGESVKANGIIISGLGYGARQVNGIGIGGLGFVGDTLNGLFMSPLGIFFWNTEEIKLINGVTIGLIVGASTEKLNGISISMFNNWIGEQNGVTIGMINRAEKLHGIQFGLWNFAANNKNFKYMPLVNFNFRRKISKKSPE